MKDVESKIAGHDLEVKDLPFQEFRFFTTQIKRGESSNWSPTLYSTVWDSDQMTIGKTLPSLSNKPTMKTKFITGR